MTYRGIFGAFVAALLLGCSLWAYEPPKKYTKDYNRNQFEKIQKRIVALAKAQLGAWEEKCREYESSKSSSSGMGMNPGMMMGPGGQSESASDPDAPKDFQLDIARLKKDIQKEFGGNESDYLGANPKVDLRTKEDFLVEAAKTVDAQPAFQGNFKALKEKEIKDAEAKYPLYRQGEMVSITFSYGKEPAKTYRGTFKKASPYKVWIGNFTLNKNDLPELLRARFYPDLNAEMRKKEIERHRLLTEFENKREDAIQEEVARLQQKQYEQNLPNGWVKEGDIWKMPSELVELTIQEHKLVVHKAYRAKNTNNF